MALTLKELDFRRCRHWIIDADSKLKADAPHALMSAWIGFNHYYGTYASANEPSFQSWVKTNANGRPGDKAQWRFLINEKPFSEFFTDFKKHRNSIFQNAIDLPVIDMLTQRQVPSGITGSVKLDSLNTMQLFEVVYQIRNNLFHGSKDPFSSQRDAVLSSLAAQFMLRFTSCLLASTFGEVLNAYDNDLNAQIAAVKAIAEA